MTVETTPIQSRRAVLAAAVGGTVALVASALGRPLAVDAANGDPVTVGGSFTGTAATSITNSAGDAVRAINSATSESGLFGHATAATGVTYGVFARSNSTAGTGVAGVSFVGSGTTKGVYGEAQSPAGFAVFGHANGGTGVLGESTSGVGVKATSQSNDAIYCESASGSGVHAQAANGTGVFAHSDTQQGLFAQSDALDGAWCYGPETGVVGWSPVKTGVVGYSGQGLAPPQPIVDVGVYGFAADSASAIGVLGNSVTGRGVQGQATSGLGVRGEATSGLGVRGVATSGVGLSGQATTGYALRTTGRVRLDKSAGKATIASGASTVVVNPGIDLTSTSVVIATLNGNAGGSTAIKRVALDTTANTFTIHLTANSTASVSVGWLVLG